MLKEYSALRSFSVQSAWATLGATPLAWQPARKRSPSESISERIFLPMALRRSSASAGENPARDLAICIACSW